MVCAGYLKNSIIGWQKAKVLPERGEKKHTLVLSQVGSERERKESGLRLKSSKQSTYSDFGLKCWTVEIYGNVLIKTDLSN